MVELKPHVRVYLDAHGLKPGDWIGCEWPGCPLTAVDISHKRHRGMGGSKLRDVPENLWALCRHHHEVFDRTHKMVV